MIDWLPDLLIDWLIDWLIYCNYDNCSYVDFIEILKCICNVTIHLFVLNYLLRDWPRLINWIFYWLVEFLIDVDSLIYGLIDCLLDIWIEWLIYWWFVVWLIDRLKRPISLGLVLINKPSLPGIQISIRFCR